MKQNEKLATLVELIEKHPNCSFDVDNDVWYMMDGGEEVATSETFGYSTRWYGHSSNYGVGIAEALLAILNKKGFNITVNAV